MPYDLPASIEPRGPTGEGDYIAQEGDCIESIAYLNGHIWQTIWDHPNNAALKTSRGSHNILLPGDQVFIPERVLGSVDCATDARHEFEKQGTTCMLRICILEAGEPRANEKYKLVIDDDQVKTGTTDAEGWIQVALPPNAQKGELKIGSNSLQAPYTLALGGMDPITEPAGIQKRLRNLGFPCDLTGELDEATRTALATFQKGEDLDATGDPDRDTLERLKTRSGC
jgi:hypothetical protein